MPRTMTVKDCRDHVHTMMLGLRNMYTIVASDKFEMAYNSYSEDQKKQMWHAIESDDPDQVSVLLRRFAVQDISLMSVKYLRLLAARYGISGYNHMSKAGLLSVITQAKERHERNAALLVGQNETVPKDGKSDAKAVEAIG